ncbi:FtsX-like permease family protein [Paenibacillus sp. FSL R7-0312]|uniref:ABC transporter permease n=1 Tax=Paenibacillus sp. FSL R7-0312 TaxID=2921682 RepID=UPI0030F6AD52
MVKSSLNKKLIRDVQGAKIQFLSIIIMLTLGVAVFIGLDSTWRSLEEYTATISADNNLSDIQIFSSIISEEDVNKVRLIDGVENAERRLNLQVNVANLPEAKLELNGMESGEISTFTVQEGAGELQEGEALLDFSFAKANHIAIGDPITLQLQDREASFRIAGLCTSAAYIYTTSDATAVIPDHKQYGFIAVRPQDTVQITGQSQLYNELLITTASGTDDEQLKNEISGMLDNKLVGSVTRLETRNDMSIKQKVAQYQSIGNLFPFVFFAVVILMTFTTMIRLMNNQRQQIGLLKAMGYTRTQIAVHYISYGIWISIIGSVLGIIIGWKVIPGRVWDFFEELFVLPDAHIILYWPKVVAIIVLAVSSTVLATLYVCLQTEKEQPAALLRPKLAQNGSHIAVERFKSWWGGLSASYRLILRQMFRNKIRLFMTIIGVLGCTALLLTALGMRDTIKNVAASVYGKTYLYETKHYLKDGISEEVLQSLQEQKQTEPILETVLVLSSDSKKKMGTIHVLEDHSQFIHFFDSTARRLDLTADGALITQKTADIYHLKVGDKIHVRIAPEQSVYFEVADIAKVNIGQGVYVSREAWQAKGLSFRPTAILSGSGSAPLPEGIVSRTVATDDQSRDFMTSMNSTLSLSVMMIAAAAVLAFIVLYNLGMLNFAERERDLATLLVLGFHPKELRGFVVMENSIFSLIGIVIGIPAGFELHRMIFAKAGMGDELDFSAVILNNSIFLSILFTVVIAVAVNMIVLSRVQKIHMVGALKSVE